MRRFQIALVLGLPFVALGCDEPTPDAGSTSSGQGAAFEKEKESQLVLSPLDLSTGVRGPIVASLFARPKLSKQEIDAISASLSLVTWPDGQPVDFEVVVEGAGGEVYSTTFLFVLKSPLEQGFLAASVDLTRIPERLAAGLQETSPKRPGAMMTRVALDSKLLVQATASKPAPGGYEVTIQFSGRVRDQRKPGEVVALHSGSRGLECVLKEAALLKDEEGTDTLVFTCPGTQPTQIRIPADLKDLGDMRLGDMYGGDFTADLLEGRVDAAARLGL